MGNVNSIPIVSQAKSLFQICWDWDGACETQRDFLNFWNEVTSVVKDSYYDAKARDKFYRGLSTAINGFLDGIPVVGHIKGGIHYLSGNSEAAVRSWKAATRVLAVTVGGILAGIAGGPGAAAGGGIGGGVIMDAIITSSFTFYFFVFCVLLCVFLRKCNPFTFL